MKSVICSFCNTEIYNYTGPEDTVSMKAEYFKPTAPEFKQPKKGDPLICPVCGVKFVAISNQLGQLRFIIDPAYKGSGAVGNVAGSKAAE